MIPFPGLVVVVGGALVDVLAGLEVVGFAVVTTTGGGSFFVSTQ